MPARILSVKPSIWPIPDGVFGAARRSSARNKVKPLLQATSSNRVCTTGAVRAQYGLWQDVRGTLAPGILIDLVLITFPTKTEPQGESFPCSLQRLPDIDRNTVSEYSGLLQRRSPGLRHRMVLLSGTAADAAAAMILRASFSVTILVPIRPLNISLSTILSLPFLLLLPSSAPPLHPTHSSPSFPCNRATDGMSASRSQSKKRLTSLKCCDLLLQSIAIKL